MLPSALLLRWMAHIRMSFDDVWETSPRMWNTLNFMVDCYTVQVGRHSTRARRLEAALRVSVAVLASGKERSNGGSGFQMALGDSGTMQMGVGEGGTMWRGVCWCRGLDVQCNSTSSSCRDCLGTRPETLIIAQDASLFRHYPPSSTCLVFARYSQSCKTPCLHS
jgi:hypothetical protein